MNNCFLGKWFYLLPSVLLLMAVDARAYLDPGTGSYTFQLLIAGLTSAFFVVSSLKRKIVSWFSSRSKTDGAPPKDS
jgi:hypothetical protein